MEPHENQSRMITREPWRRLLPIFSLSVGGALWVTAVLKLSAVAAAIPELDSPDPVFGVLTTRQILLLAAVLEVAVGRQLLRWQEDPRALGLIAWLVIAFLAYRGAAWFNGWRGPCHCLGGRYGWAYFVPVYLQDGLTKLLLLWMLFGTGILSWWAGRGSRATETRPAPTRAEEVSAHE